MSATDLTGPLLLRLLQCAEESLTVPVGRSHLAPGASVAWDDCCLGQLWVRLVSKVPTGSSRDPGQRCGVVLWRSTVAVGVMRCAHVVDDQGNPPSPDDLTQDALAVTRDMTDLEQAILCCMRDVPGALGLTVLAWNPLGPSGGCVGGEWTLTVTEHLCGCP